MVHSRALEPYESAGACRCCLMAVDRLGNHGYARPCGGRPLTGDHTPPYEYEIETSARITTVVLQPYTRVYLSCVGEVLLQTARCLEHLL